MTRATDGRMLRAGEVQSLPDDSPASCYPAAPSLYCSLCSRRRHGEPPEPEVRLNHVIDASAISQRGSCAMFIGRPAARSFHEPAEREETEAFA